MAANEIYQIKATIMGSRPPIWRRILVRPDIDLHEFHCILQGVFGWDDSHLHEFIAGDERYLMPHPGFDDDLDSANDEQEARLGSVIKRVKGRIRYVYDFGDCWEHEILLEKKLPEEAGAQYPVCIKGKQNGPPEDSGGVWGYGDLLDAVRNPDHPEHDEMLEWIGEDFDPEAFDLEAANKRLAHFWKHPPATKGRKEWVKV